MLLSDDGEDDNDDECGEEATLERPFAITVTVNTFPYSNKNQQIGPGYTLSVGAPPKPGQQPEVRTLSYVARLCKIYISYTRNTQMFEQLF